MTFTVTGGTGRFAGASGSGTNVSWYVGPVLHVYSTGTLTVILTQDECKDGGWQGYGVFKNQDDCVSYVASDGSNAPG